MSAVVIRVDPAKRSHAIEVIDDRERTQAAGVFANDNVGYRQMRDVTRPSATGCGRSRAPVVSGSSSRRGWSRTASR